MTVSRVGDHRKAFVLRISPSGENRLQEALAANQILIGWSAAEGLLDPTLGWEAFRQIIHDTHHAGDKGYRKSGNAAGHMWRFIRLMQAGDLVVVPAPGGFYVAEVKGEPTWDASKTKEDTAYRRPVAWLNGKQPIVRRVARAALQSRMKTQGTCADASDLVADIRQVLDEVAAGYASTFEADLRQALITRTLKEIQSGRMNEREFERLLAAILGRLGAKNVQVQDARQLDKGADIVATLTLLGAFKFKVAVQAKFYQPKPPVGAEPVHQVAAGMEAEGAELGLVITSGTFSPKAHAAVEDLKANQGKWIELIDGEVLAALIVENGLVGQQLHSPVET